MKKLTFIGPYPPNPLFYSEHVKTLADTMSRDYDVSVYTYHDVSGGNENGVDIVPAISRYAGFFGSLGLFFRSMGSSIVHLHYDMKTPSHLLWMLPLLRGLGKRVYCSVHGPIAPSSLFSWYNHVIIHSRDQHPLVTGTSVWIPYGIGDYPLLPRKGSGKTFLLHGPLLPAYGFLEALQAFAPLAKKYKAKMIIVGEPTKDTASVTYHRKLKSFVSRHHLDQYVSFQGAVAESRLAEVYSRADVVVYPSQPGGFIFPHVLAYQRILIGSDVFGMRDIIKDGVNGFLYDSGDVSELRSIMLKTIKQSKKSDAIIKQGIELADRRGWWKLQAAYAKMYTS